MMYSSQMYTSLSLLMWCCESEKDVFASLHGPGTTMARLLLQSQPCPGEAEAARLSSLALGRFLSQWRLSSKRSCA